jgi:hypothetical protein
VFWSVNIQFIAQCFSSSLLFELLLFFPVLCGEGLRERILLLHQISTIKITQFTRISLSIWNCFFLLSLHYNPSSICFSSLFSADYCCISQIAFFKGCKHISSNSWGKSLTIINKTPKHTQVCIKIWFNFEIPFPKTHFPLNQRHYLLIKLYLWSPATTPKSIIKHFRVRKGTLSERKKNVVNYFMLFRLDVIWSFAVHCGWKWEFFLKGVFYGNESNN